MREFEVDIDKLINGVNGKTDSQGYVYPTHDFIQEIPEEYKSFDIELSDMHSDELLNKLSVFTSLLASASVDEARYMVQVASIQRELEIVKAAVFTSSTAEKIRAREKERDSNPEVVKLQEKLTIAEAFLKRYTALRIGYEKFCFLYSRALTIQTEEKKFQ